MADKFAASEPRVPTLDEITTLYKHAVDQKDKQLQSVAELAVQRLAAAEAAAAEAATFVDFAGRVRV
jgi:hypothetical protein